MGVNKVKKSKGTSPYIDTDVQRIMFQKLLQKRPTLYGRPCPCQLPHRIHGEVGREPVPPVCSPVLGDLHHRSHNPTLERRPSESAESRLAFPPTVRVLLQALLDPNLMMIRMAYTGMKR